MPVKIANDTPKFYVAQVSASGDTTIIAAPTGGQQIEIVGYKLELRAAVATTMLLKDGASGNQGTVAREDGAAIGDGTKGAVFFPDKDRPKLTKNVALVLNLSAAQPVNVHVWYNVK